jgi:hypothetical protein
MSKTSVSISPVLKQRAPEVGDERKRDHGKLGGFWLIPTYPLRELVRVFGIGAKKYRPRGWEAGMEWSRIFDAMNRHILAWLDGETHDPTDGQHHLASVAWAALVLMEYERTHPEFDDLLRPLIDGDATVAE